MAEVPSRGQSLVEVLIGVGIAAIFLIGIAAVIAPSLQENKQAAQVQAKTELANELFDNVRAWAMGNWNGVLSLATGTSGMYYLSTATSSFAVATGSVESVAIGSSTYTRYFYILDAYRDGSGNVTSTAAGNFYDPSAKLVMVVVAASSSQLSATTTLPFYLTRNGLSNVTQASWAGGAGQDNPETLVGTDYASSSNVVVTADGSIQLARGGVCN